MKTKEGGKGIEGVSERKSEESDDASRSSKRWKRRREKDKALTDL